MRYRIGTLSEGSELNGRLRAVCECGWSGPWRPGLSDSVVAVEGDVEDHAASHEGGAQRAPFYVRSALGVGYHFACRSHHSLADGCPLAPRSPEGMLRALFAPTTRDPERATALLKSAVAFCNMVQQSVVHAAFAARRSGVSWDVITELCKLEFDLNGPWLRAARALAACPNVQNGGGDGAGEDGAEGSHP
jgi:hypothetical protein